MTPVLLYSHADEPITKSLLSSELGQKNGLIKLPLKRLLEEATISDDFSIEETNIKWTFSSGFTILNTSKFYLINRVISVPEELFNNFHVEDRAYSLQEFRSYLAFAIESFPVVFSKPGAFGLSGNRFSLPRQWEIIRRSRLKYNTPNYYLGNMSFCSIKNNLVYSDPFNFYFWKPNSNNEQSSKFSFAFSRPRGVPVVVFLTSKEFTLFCPTHEESIIPGASNLLKSASRNILRMFNYEVAEILFFVENKSFTFGMISNIPYASSKKDWFQNLVTTHFESKIL